MAFNLRKIGQYIFVTFASIRFFSNIFTKYEDGDFLLCLLPSKGKTSFLAEKFSAALLLKLYIFCATL